MTGRASPGAPQVARRARRGYATRLFGLTLACGIGLAATAHADRTTSVTLANAVSRHTQTARWLQRADPNDTLPMSITFGVRHADELQTLISAQHDPRSPLYHHWLTPSEIADRFAPPPAEYAAVVDWLVRQGFQVRPAANRLRIEFSGPVRRVEPTFGVHMHRYAHRGRTCLANADAPRVPAEFAEAITVLRLNTFPLAQPLVRVLLSGGSANVMAPRDMYSAYDVTPLLDRQIDGSGQTIAIAARSNFNDSDVTDFQLRFGVPVRGALKAFPGGDPGVGAVNGICHGIGNPDTKNECVRGEEGEVLLDVQWAGAMAPGADVLVDIADTDIDASFADIVNNHPEAKVISMSFGACERVAAVDVKAFRPLYVAAVAQGQTVLVATGDAGTDDCQTAGPASVNALATDVYVTAVGGTALDPGFDAFGNATGYVGESVWNDSSGASGGGASTLVVKPPYQEAPGVPADGVRDVPDIALLGSPLNPGYAIVFGGGIVVVGGTSVSTPGWAGVVGLLNQALGADGIGSLNPLLYDLGRKQYGAGGPLVFHDVTSGSNGFKGVSGFSAGPGFDLATGLGTPDADRLIRVLEARACIGDCNHDGSVSDDELLLGTQILLGTVPLSMCPEFDVNIDGRVTIDEVIAATNQARTGCH